MVCCLAVSVWLSTFFKRLWRVAALHFLGSVFASLCSQVFQIAAFLLPLKVMILLGSPGVPRYFPSVLADVDRERLILMLAAAAVALYLAHLLMEFMGTLLAQTGGQRLVDCHQEQEPSAKQKKIALTFYRGFITFSSGSFFALGVLLFLGFVHPVLLWVVLGYFVLCFVVATWFFSWFPTFRESNSARFKRIIDILSAIGFLLVFGFLVADFLYGAAEGLLLGILSLLLCRQMFSRLAMALKSIERLYSHRDRFASVCGVSHTSASSSLGSGALEGELESDFLDDVASSDDMFFKRGITPTDARSLSVSSLNEQPTFWQIISRDHGEDLLRQSLVRAGAKGCSIEIKQLDEGLRGQLFLYVQCSRVRLPSDYFFFRALSCKKSKLAGRAIDILSVYPGSGAPTVADVSVCGSVTLHLYSCGGEATAVCEPQDIVACREQLFVEAMRWPIPADLMLSVENVSLVQRCGIRFWSRCQAFSRWLDADTQLLVDTFARNPDRLSRVLERLPLVVYNPDVTIGRVFKVKDSYKVTSWGRWTLEPLGSGWPLSLGWDRLGQVCADELNDSESLQGLSVVHIKVAALAFEFEALCEQGSYTQAFVLLRQVRDLLDELDL